MMNEETELRQEAEFHAKYSYFRCTIPGEETHTLSVVDWIFGLFTLKYPLQHFQNMPTNPCITEERKGQSLFHVFFFCSDSCLITKLICSLNYLIAWKIWNRDSCKRQTFCRCSGDFSITKCSHTHTSSLRCKCITQTHTQHTGCQHVQITVL